MSFNMVKIISRCTTSDGLKHSRRWMPQLNMPVNPLTTHPHRPATRGPAWCREHMLMKTILAQYEHATIGFPHVKLKWTEENGKWSPGYVTRLGIIDESWTWMHAHHISAQNVREELERFDQHIRAKYSNVAEVQG